MSDLIISKINLNGKTYKLAATVADDGGELASKEYVEEVLEEYATKSELPDVPVKSVNGKTGEIILSGEDVRIDGENSDTLSTL